MHQYPQSKLVNVCNIDNLFTLVRWSCLSWPAKIENMIETTHRQLEGDEERFHKNLLAEQNLFQDRLDGLNMVVAGFSTYTDIQK